MSFWFARRRLGSVAIISALLLSLLIPVVSGQQDLPLSRQGKLPRTRPESDPVSPQQKKPTKPVTTSTALSREDYLKLRQEQIDRIAGRSAGKRLISEIEREWQPSKTNAVARSMSQDVQATPQVVVPKG